MHQTTIRFGPDLWAALEHESSRAGVSIAHYVRDATLHRLALDEQSPASSGGLADVIALGRSTRLADRIEAQLSRAPAVRSQGRLARDRASRLRDEAATLRKRAHTR